MSMSGVPTRSRAAASNQMVMSPRRRKDSSYWAQFRTVYLVLYSVFTLLCAGGHLRLRSRRSNLVETLHPPVRSAKSEPRANATTW